MSEDEAKVRGVSVGVKRLLPWLVAVAFFMEAVDTTILNTAVPAMAKALGVDVLSMKSVLSSYTLSVAVFIPLSSWLADRFGTRRVFGTAIGLFTLGSLLCGLSTNLPLLVVCRLLQGFGGAMMVPVGRLTLVRTFARSELIRAMSFVAIPALIGPMLGPVAGGFIVAFLHWRVIFFVNIPIGLLGLYLVHKHLPDFRAEKSERLDLIGLILFSSGVALLSYVLEIFGDHTLGPFEITGLLGLSLLLLVTYGLHARRTLFPLLNLQLLRIRTLRVAVGGNFITRLAAGGMPFLLPLLYQVGMGYTPVQSGLMIIPQPLAALCLKMSMQGILTRFGFRKVLIANTMLMGLSIGLYALIGIGTSLWAIVLLACSFGFSSSLQYTSMNTLAYADIAERDTSMASTIVSTIQQMSISFGIATASIVTALFIPIASGSAAQELIKGLHYAFLFLGILTIGSAVLFRELGPNDGDNVSQHHVE